MKELVKCPVCGKENEYEWYSEWGCGTIEQHYYCPRCTYFVEKCYSDTLVGICTDCPEEYLDKANELDLEFFKPEEMPY